MKKRQQHLNLSLVMGSATSLSDFHQVSAFSRLNEFLMAHHYISSKLYFTYSVHVVPGAITEH